MGVGSTAELVIEGRPEKLYGTVIEATETGCRIRPQNRPEGETSPDGAQANVTLHVSGTMLNAPAQIVTDSGAEIQLGFVSAMRRYQARNDYRLECRLPIIIRSVNASGCVGAWRIAETFDISVGGIGVHVDPPFRHLGHIEICLRLPGDSRPLRTSCRQAYHRTLPDGHIALGLQFPSLAALDKVRLSSFIAESLGAAAA